MNEKNTTLRKRIFHILEITWHSGRGIGFWANVLLTLIIILNAIAIVLDTVPAIQQKYHRLLLDFEVFSVVIFSLEYILRVWSCVEAPRHHHPIYGRLDYIFSWWGLIDLMSILPFYLSLFVTDLGVVRILRLLRMVRLFRMSRYFYALRAIQIVIKDKRAELTLSFVFISLILIISSSLMYYVEHQAQPKAFASIPSAMWWGVSAITITTVGYGDVHPITPLGKFLGGILSMIGLALFALPTSILASGFTTHMKKEQKKRICPHCGEELTHY